MKKLSLLLTAALLLSLAACKSKTPVPEMLDIMNECTEQIEKAKSLQEVESATSKMSERIKKLKDDYPDYKPDDKEKNEIVEATIAMSRASMQAYSKFAVDVTTPAEASADEEAAH